MFGARKAVAELEYEVRKLRDRIEIVEARTLGETIENYNMVYVPSGRKNHFGREIYKSFPVNRVVQVIMEHLGIEMQYIKAQEESFKIVKKKPATKGKK